MKKKVSLFTFFNNFVFQSTFNINYILLWETVLRITETLLTEQA